MKHSNTLFTVQIWVIGQLIRTVKQKNIGSEKVQVLFNTKTYVLKSRQFHEQVGSPGFQLALKDFLLIFMFLVPLSSETGFLFKEPREILLFF